MYISIYALVGRISHTKSSAQGHESFKIQNLFFHVVLYGCEACYLTLREEHVMGVFENRALRKIFGPKRDEVTGNRVNCIMRRFMIFTPH
jgi:hypothetical protein